MSPNVFEALSASPLLALGLAAGALVLVVLVVRALRRRGAKAPAASTPSRERRAPRVAETATDDDAGASARAPVPPSPVERPSAVTALDVEPAPPVEHAADVVARAAGAAAVQAFAQAPSAEPPGAVEPSPLSSLPFAHSPTPPAGHAAPSWFDAIPTPDVVEVAAPEPGPEAMPEEVAFTPRAPSDAEPPTAPSLADDVRAEAIGEGSAVDAFAPFELAVDDTVAAWPQSDADPAATVPPVAEPAHDEPLPAFTLAEPVGDDVVATTPEPALAAELPCPETGPAAQEDLGTPPSLAAAPPVDPAPAPVAEPPSVATVPPADAGPARLLVVDDSAVVRAKLRKVLEGGGHKVEVAKDGREALALLAAGRYALMVTDLEMPTMSGFELIAAVRASAGLAALPIVAITGHDDLEPYRQRLPGLAGLFRKPWVDGELLAQLAGVLAQTRSAPDPASAPSPEPQPMALA